jgi:hypothetical protein
VTAVGASAVTAHRSPWVIAAPAIISVATFLVLTLVVTWGWGEPTRFWSESGYRNVMDASVLLRLGPIYLSGFVVWPVMRLRGATIPWAALGTAASPLAFGIVGAMGALTFFPPAQAAYYALNPMVIAAMGSAVGAGAVGEVFVRWRQRGRLAMTPRALVLAAVIASAGFGLFYIGVIWDGGRHWFYLWIRGFMILFGTGR